MTDFWDASVQGDRSEIFVRMTHCHLPMMESAGIIEWDKLTQIVEPGPEFAHVRPFLDLCVEQFDDGDLHTNGVSSGT